MQCPQCESSEIRKNGHVRDRQRYRCKNCGYQFIEGKYSQDTLNVETENTPVLKTEDISNVVTIYDSEKINVAKVDISEKQEEHVIEISELQQINLKIEEILQLLQSKRETGISIILLDAENINKFEPQLEAFLSSLSAYPLQVKIAFANWKNTSGDIELYNRGYQLIHVPSGKNSADAQMIAIGAGICRHYPDAKEVFVCSSDWLLNHLCNELQTQGLYIYRVRQHNNNITIENRQTGEIKHYSLAVNLEIPSFEDLAKQMEFLIKEEHDNISQRIAKLSTIINLFQERANLSFNVNNSNIGLVAEQNANSNVLSKEEFTEQPIQVTEVAKSNVSSEKVNLGAVTSWDSMEGLENLIIEMVTAMIRESSLNYVSVDNIKANFQAIYKRSADLTIKQFKPNSSLIKFVRSRNKLFTITLVEGEHRVSLAQAISREI